MSRLSRWGKRLRLSRYFAMTRESTGSLQYERANAYRQYARRNVVSAVNARSYQVGAAWQRPCGLLGQGRDVLRGRRDDDARERRSAASGLAHRRVQRDIHPHAVAHANDGAAHHAPGAKPLRERARLIEREWRRGCVEVRQDAECVLDPDAADAIEVRAQRNRELAAEPSERAVRRHGCRWQDDDRRGGRGHHGSSAPPRYRREP